MAWTVRPVNRNGTLEISEDGKKIGHGRMKVSSSEKGMITLTLHISAREEKSGGYMMIVPAQTEVIRVPIDWTQALAQVPTEEDD